MEESVTDRAILRNYCKQALAEAWAEGFAEGSLAEARNIVLLRGKKMIGVPNSRVRAAVEVLELEKLEELVLRVDEVSTWEELLGLPAKGRGPKR